MGKQRASRTRHTDEAGPHEPGPGAADPQGLLDTCQRILRGLTGVMIGAFVLIILLTTFSTGSFVQFAGRWLYYLILAAAVASLGTWLTRLWTERKAGRAHHVVTEVLRKL